jgi:hypothetical protein
VTDLKTATQELTEALAALESGEHEDDVRTAEAHRMLLLELDARMAARIQAKLQAHQAIVNAWGSEPAPIVATDTAEQPVIEAMAEINDWMGKPDETPAANRELIEGTIPSGVIPSGVGVAVEPVEPSPVYIPPEQRGGEPAYYNPYHAKIMAQETVLGKIPIVYSEDGTLLPPPVDSALDADAWKAHHEAFHTSYAQSGDEITEPVLEVSVAEMAQAELVTES